MTTVSLADLRNRLYEAYATQHAGCGGDEAATLVYQRDIRPLLPSPAAGPGGIGPYRGRGPGPTGDFRTGHERQCCETGRPGSALRPLWSLTTFRKGIR